MDGTLVDSEHVWDRALDELAAHYGGALSPGARLAMVGAGLPESMVLLHTDLGQPWRDAAYGEAWVIERVSQLFAEGLEWRPGARELLTEVRAAGIPTALVTSTFRALVEVALGTMGRDSFDAVVCGDEVARSKPHPTPYLTAAGLLGVPIHRCVVVEDSPTGVAGARASGATVIAVPCAVELPDTSGVVLRDSLVGLTVADLGELVAGAPADSAAPA